MKNKDYKLTISMLETMKVMKDLLGDLSNDSVYADDILNEEVLEITTIINKMEEKLNAK